MANSSDFSKPQTTDTYVNVTAEVNALANDLAKGLDPATTTPANVPTNAVRWNSANGFWEKFSGTTWAALAGVYNIVASSANKLKTAVTIAIGGDISGSASFDGSQNISITATLPNVNANPGTVGSTSAIPVITTNAKGQVTAVSQAGISVPVTSVFGRTGAVALASSDVTGALGYTPYDTGSAANLANQIAGKLSNSGGSVSGNITMTSGALIYSSQSGAADNARNTGYKMNDGQDIGEMNRSSQYYDDRANNCSGYLPNGNCLGNAQWNPPNGNWWTWGLGFGPANPGYDFAGGQSVSYQPVSVGFVYGGYYLAADEIGGGEYLRIYNNCNCGGFNCYSNCNCNCDCNCNCNC